MEGKHLGYKRSDESKSRGLHTAIRRDGEERQSAGYQQRMKHGFQYLNRGQLETARLGISHTYSSRSHSLKTSLRRPHSIVKTSDRIEADEILNWTPERSTVLGCVEDAC